NCGSWLRLRCSLAVLGGGFLRSRTLARRRRRRLANLLEVLLYKLLVHQRNLIAMDLATRVRVLSLPLRKRRLKLLFGRPDLHHHFARHIGRSLPRISLSLPMACSNSASRALLSPSSEPTPLFESCGDDLSDD